MSAVLVATPLRFLRDRRARSVAPRGPWRAPEAMPLGDGALAVRFSDGRVLIVERTRRGWLAYTQGVASSARRGSSLEVVLERSAVRERDLEPARLAVQAALRLGLLPGLAA